jgi:hypothetical protein
MPGGVGGGNREEPAYPIVSLGVSLANNIKGRPYEEEPRTCSRSEALIRKGFL